MNKCLLGLWLLLAGLPLAAQTKTETLTNASVIALHKAGLDDALIIAKIEASPCKFDVTTNGLIALKNGGLSAPVMEAVMNKAQGKKAVIKKEEDKPVQPTPVPVKKTPVPEFVNQPSYYDQAANKLLALEKVKADQKTKAKGLFGGYTMTLELAGEASPVKLPQSEKHSFLLTMGDGMGEPSGFYGLYKAEIKKGKRSAVWVQSKTGQTASGDGMITFSSKSAGDKVFEIIPNQKLEKGQYFFINKGSALTYGGQGYEAFAFSVE